MALQDLLDPEIFTYNDRDFENWLKAGIPVYTGVKEPKPGERVPDAFPHARGLIGRNEAGLSADLKNVYDLLPSVTQVEMERGVRLLWAATQFKNEAQFAIGRILLELACQIQVNAMVDLLPDSLTFLAIAHEKASTDAERRRVMELRWLSFQAALELVSAASRSISCLELFMEDGSFDEPLLAQGQALEIVRYLAEKFPGRFVYWAGIFGHAIVADYKASEEPPRALRLSLEEAYGEKPIAAAIEAVRVKLIREIQTEDGALSRTSLRGLYDLVPILYAGRADALDDEAPEMSVWPWDENERKPTKTGVLLKFDRKFRAEMKGGR